MLNLTTASKLKRDEVIGRAVAFFGPEGLGLEVKDTEDGYALFEGGGGGVEIIARAEGKHTGIDITSREWDYQIKEFIEAIH